jgi:hypothetical protein
MQWINRAAAAVRASGARVAVVAVGVMTSTMAWAEYTPVDVAVDASGVATKLNTGMTTIGGIVVAITGVSIAFWTLWRWLKSGVKRGAAPS